MVKCFLCPRKADIRVQEATQCPGCNSYYHARCAIESRAGRLENGSFKKCCGEDDGQESVQDSEPDEDMSISELWQKIKLISNENTRRIETKLDKATKRITVVESKVNDLQTRVEMIESNGKSENVITEVKDQMKREKNVIVFDLPDTKSEVNDLKTVKDLLKDAPVTMDSIRVYRLGNFTKDKVRPLKVCFSSSEEAFWVLKHLKNENINCTSDKTTLQRKILHEVLEELKTKEQAGTKNLTVKYINGTPRLVPKAKKK